MIDRPETLVSIDPALLANCEEKRYVIVHCRNFTGGGAIRIWESTYLQDANGHRAKLLFAIGISTYPHWCFIEKANGYSYFTLIFESLPAVRAPFRLIEDIPEPGGFYSASTARNQSDVYHIELFCN
ncbi:MAG: hypothetical protein EOO03_15045 [Chitinophagaceae bacterium]|nr:MAG: hypothetical protein EOO03_15045 [Chitinophagaceae bacterium]